MMTSKLATNVNVNCPLLQQTKQRTEKCQSKMVPTIHSYLGNNSSAQFPDNSVTLMSHLCTLKTTVELATIEPKTFSKSSSGIEAVTTSCFRDVQR